MKRIGTVFMLFALLVSTLLGCTNEKVSNGDWHSNFIVWNGLKYDVKATSFVDKEKIADAVGVVEILLEGENSSVDTTKTFSNKYPKDTKIYKLKDVATDKEIAVEIKDGTYVLGVSTGKYGEK